MRTVAKKPVLKHLGFNAARPGAARETCRCLRNALFVAVQRHGVQQVVGIGGMLFSSSVGVGGTTSVGCVGIS